MTDKIIISRKEIEELFAKYDMGRLSLSVIDDLRALLDKAEVSEPVGYKVTGKLGERCSFKSSEVKKGDIIYTTPQPNRVAELQDAVRVLVEALQKAEQFITNGVKIGRIRMPDDDLKGVDSAHDTPRIIREALESVEGEKWTNLV